MPMIQNSRPCAALATVLSTAMLASHPVEARMQQEPASVSEEDQVARATVAADGATLEVAFDPAGQRLAVRYRISNTGDVPLAVFDRGDRHAVLTRKLVAGEVAAPRFEEGADGLTLSHAARALPSPAPTLPPVPLATKLAPGTSLDAAFAFDLSLAGEAARVRWCLGVARFDDATFEPDGSAGEVGLWTAPFEMAETQQLLCTPWFDMAAGTFATG
jgi:hypothetical protein